MSRQARCSFATSRTGWTNRAAAVGRLVLASVLVMGWPAGAPATGGQAAGASAAGPGGTERLTPELIRERTEREWDVKAEKMRRHLLPLMRAHESISGSS